GAAGRKLQVVTCDDGGHVARGRACYEKLKGNVFAMVPSVTWLTDVIHDRLTKDKVPWLSWGWFKSEYEDPWMFPCHANGMREASAVADWVGKVIKPKTVGIMYLNVSEDIAAKDVATKQLKQAGINVVETVAQEWDSAEQAQQLLRDELIKTNGREYQGFKWRYAGMHHITQSGWVCTRILAKAAEQLGADLTRDGLKKVLESKAWDSGVGSTLYWNAADHNSNQNYSYNREFIYKWISAADGGWDLKRILPDPVFDCKGGNIPAAAKTVCN